MRSRIGELIRSNLALAFLCIISIGVLVILLRPVPAKESSHVVPPQMVLSDQHLPAQSSLGDDSSKAAPLEAFAQMPDPRTYISFLYTGQSTLMATGTCADMYRVTMIFPQEIDYRSNPAAALYNTASTCTTGKQFSSAISLTGIRFETGHTYYLIRASQGSTGTWYNPY